MSLICTVVVYGPSEAEPWLLSQVSFHGATAGSILSSHTSSAAEHAASGAARPTPSFTPPSHTFRYGHLSVAERAAGAAMVPLDPSVSRYVNGYLLLCGGEACPSALPAPFKLGEDITSE